MTTSANQRTTRRGAFRLGWLLSLVIVALVLAALIGLATVTGRRAGWGLNGVLV